MYTKESEMFKRLILRGFISNTTILDDGRRAGLRSQAFCRLLLGNMSIAKKKNNNIFYSLCTT